MTGTKRRHLGGERLPSPVAGMSLNQLYDIMSDIKILIEQNQQRAREILIDNPSLTKSLFQAQIMLGMVQPPQKAWSQQHWQSTRSGQLMHQAQLPPPESAFQGQTASSQLQPASQQYQEQPSIPITLLHSPSILHTQRTVSHSAPSLQHVKDSLNTQVPSMSFAHTSEMPNLPPSAMQHPLQRHLSMMSKQAQHYVQSGGVLHQPLPPSSPPQCKPSLTQHFQLQFHAQGPNIMDSKPSEEAPLQHLAQPEFHSNTNPPASFPQVQPQLRNQPPPQHLYMDRSRLDSDFGKQGPTPMQVDRGAARSPGRYDNSAVKQFQGPSPLIPTQTSPGPGGLQRQPPQKVTNEMEKAIIQQFMSLTPEQINVLPPEQRQQVLQLQQILR